MSKKQCIMALPPKTRALICVCLAAMLALGIALWLNAAPRVTAYDRQTLEALSQDMNTCRLTAVMHEQDGTLAVTQEIDFVNRTDDVLPHLVLRTYANAYADAETSPAAIDELFDETYAEGFSAGGIEIQGLWWQEEPAVFRYADEAKTVLEAQTGPLAPGQGGTLKMMYVLSVPQCAHRFGRTETAWQLGNAFPVLSVWEDGQWRAEGYSAIGDPFISESANWHVALSLPDGMTPACSAPLAKKGQGVWEGKILCARDLALTVSRDYRVSEKQFGDVRVQVFTTGKDGRKALARCGDILETLHALYGDFPYDALTVAGVRFPFGGMEYPGLVMIDEGYFAAGDDSLELLLAHEIAHQYFYALAGSDGYYHPWQDEALCQWAVLRYVGARYGQHAESNLRYYYADAPMQENIPEKVTPGSPVSYFADYVTYDSVVYGRGCAMLCALDTFLSGRLDAFLREYVHARPFAYYRRADFETALQAFSGMDTTPLMNDYLDTLMSAVP